MTDAFMITSQYRRFVEFSQYCEDNKHIGLCYGKPGVGKSESAMHYANWQTIEALIGKPVGSRKLPESIVTCKAAFLTPDVTITPKRLQSSISLLRNRFDALIDQAMDCYKPEARVADPSGRHLKLLIVDEADRLKFQCLELLRDFHDRGNMSIVLMGMPGIERRLKRFGQLHSRIHFAYEFLPLTPDEMRLFINQKWLELKLPLHADDAVSTAIMRIANGNFRILHRIFTEIERLQKLNCLPIITTDLIEMAKRALVLGTI